MTRDVKIALAVVLIAVGLAAVFPAEALGLFSGVYTVGLSGNGLFYIGIAGGAALLAGVWLLVTSMKVPR